MKVNSKILIGLICVIILSGCNDSFLDRIPLDDLTDETYWKTEEHLILAANACINGLRGKGTSVDMEMLGDNVVRERSASYKNIGAGTFTSDLSTINSECGILTIMEFVVVIISLRIMKERKRLLRKKEKDMPEKPVLCVHTITYI